MFYNGEGRLGTRPLAESEQSKAYQPFVHFIPFLAIVAGGSTFGEEQGFAEDDLLDGFVMIEKIISKNDFVLGITAGGHTR